MADSAYGGTGDYFMETGFEIKHEPLSDGTASMPIPRRAGAGAVELTDLRDFDNFELDICSQDGSMQLFQTNFYNKINFDDSNSKCESFKMDDDDIFQVDKADLIQGPTLAELNANDDTLLDDLNFDDLLLPEENSFYVHLGGAMVQCNRRSAPSLRVQAPATPQPSPATPSLLGGSASSSPFDPYAFRGPSGAFSPSSQYSSASSATPSRPAVLQELVIKRDLWASDFSLGQSAPSDVVLGQSVPTAPPSSVTPSRSRPSTSRLSSSAPTHLSLEQIWQRREPRKHLLSTSSVAEVGSVSSISGGLDQDLSQDEDEKDDSDDDSDRYEDLSSDGDSDGEYDGKSKSSKKEKFFWQYNVQAKGPKGQRLVLKTKLEDPHILNEVTDPVFSPSCSVRGIKHSGKARKGDGNDLTPNPRKLYLIGKELDKLGRKINDMTPVSELPFNVRPKTKKEKNKLASRACRLKKKAQHEANKLKLYGLEQEHKRLLNGIEQMKQVISSRIRPSPSTTDWNPHIDQIVKNATKVTIAGQSSEYVNKVLDRMKAGVPEGGYHDL